MTSVLKNEGTFDPTADTTSIEGFKMNKVYPVLENQERLIVTKKEEKVDLPILKNVSVHENICLSWD